MAGHSLGEISALCCSGAISFPDALRIVRKRGKLMQAAVSERTGAMLALNGITADEVENLCGSCPAGGIVVVSNINSRNQVVISGEKNSVNAVGQLAVEKGAVKIPLKVSAPFHSPLMKPAAAGLEVELNNYKFSDLKYPVISNVTCKPYLDQNEIIPLLTEQVTTKVNWLKIMDYICKTRVNITLELPPKKILTGLFKSQKSAVTSRTFDQLDGIKNLLNEKIL
jgi:[acyl-carrier-protein] S-malonyltransferase